MTTIGQAVDALDLNLQPDETVCIILGTEGYKEYPLHAVADRAIGTDVYVSTGTFRRDQRFGKGGRTLENTQRVWALPFDFDLKDFLDVEPEDLWPLDEDELDRYRASLREAVENVAGKIGLPLHRLDSTGYGLSAYTYLPPHAPDVVPAIKALHSRIVDRINALWGSTLADRNVRDAGPRIMRLVPCLNGKGDTPRQTSTLYFTVSPVDQALLESIAGPAATRSTSAAPVAGRTIPNDLADLIVEGIAPDWTLGQKHFVSRALAGYLAKNAVPEEQTLAIIERLSADDSRPWDRIKAVHDTYDRYRRGVEIDGYQALRQMIDADALARIDTVLERHRRANSPRLIIGGKREAHESREKINSEPPMQPIIHFAPPPATAFRGWVGRYVALMAPTTEAPHAFHLGVGLTLAGAILGREVWCPYGEPTHANLFTLLVGKSGKTRKDTAIRRGTRMVTDQHLDAGKLVNTITKVITDVGSAEALMDELATHPNLMLYSTEFSKLMGNARRKATGTIIPTLMQAWDAPPIMASLTRGNPVEAHYPYMSVLAATQPEILANLMGEEDVFSGFANRWFFVAGEPTHTPIPSPPPVDAVLSRELYNELRQRREEGGRRAGGFPLSREALARWEEWYIADYHRDSDTPEEDAMRPRHASLIRKLALIYAATEGTSQITLDQLNAGIDVIEWMGKNVRRMVGTWGETSFGKLERRIREVLIAAPNHAMGRRQLQQKCSSRSWTSRDFAITLDAMKANDIVLVDAMNNVQLMTDGDRANLWEAV